MKKKRDIHIIETLFHLAHVEFKNYANCKDHVTVNLAKYPAFNGVNATMNSFVPPSLFSD